MQDSAASIDGPTTASRPASVAIRADASRVIGSGHVARCLTLANRLRSMGAEVLFICRAHDGHMLPSIAANGFDYEELPQSGGDQQGYAGWVGTDIATDWQQTEVAILRHFGGPIDWVIVDHYGLDASWEKASRSVARHVLAIDDLADRPHDCDVILDQNAVHAAVSRYEGLVPTKALRLLGPRFALLHRDFQGLQPLAGVRPVPPRSYLVYFGAGESSGRLALISVRAILGSADDGVTITVVLSNQDRHHGALRDFARHHRNIEVVDRLPSLAQAMLSADFAVGAAGATSWERVCLRLPSLVVVVADNQEFVADQLEAMGVARCAGRADTVTEESLRAALVDAIGGGGAPIASFDPLTWGVDGRGGDRVAAVVASVSGITARRVTAADSTLLLEWANDPETRANSFSTAPIPLDEHERWFARHLEGAVSRFYLIEVGTSEVLQVGQVRFDNRGGRWRLNYALAPGFRGLRLGELLLRAGLAALHATEPYAVVEAEVFQRNGASMRTIERLGFHRVRAEDGYHSFELTLTDAVKQE